MRIEWAVGWLAACGTPPAEEKLLRHAGMQVGRSGLPHSSVWYHAAAPTASLFGVFAWPYTVPLCVSYSSTLMTPKSRSNHTYCRKFGAGPS